MPDPIPIVLLARLAVTRAYQGKGLGRFLLRDAGQRVVQAAETLGIRGIVVHAASQEAKNFYEAIGFTESVADLIDAPDHARQHSRGISLEAMRRALGADSDVLTRQLCLVPGGGFTLVVGHGGGTSKLSRLVRSYRGSASLD